MAGSGALVCASVALSEGGKGVRFAVLRQGQPQAAFAVRYDGIVRAYLNRCAHVPIELDWNPGEFFDFSGLYLVCSTHGAGYAPENGRCRTGPCAGRGLVQLRVEERDGAIYLTDESSELHHV